VVFEAGSNGVQHDVPGQLEQMRLAFDHLVVKAALEQMSGEFVAPVEPVGVHAVQPVHALRDVSFPCLDEEVVVIRHQAVRVAEPSQAINRLLYQLQEAGPVVCIDEDVLLAIPTRRHVVDRAGGLDARRSGHLPTVAAAAELVRAWHQVGAETARFRIRGTWPGARH
jgi:hypothetical protein